MVYPINNYNLVLIGIPKTSGQNTSEPNIENSGTENSDNSLLAQLLQNPPGTLTVVEQLESAIRVAFGKN